MKSYLCKSVLTTSLSTRHIFVFKVYHVKFVMWKRTPQMAVVDKSNLEWGRLLFKKEDINDIVLKCHELVLYILLQLDILQGFNDRLLY